MCPICGELFFPHEVAIDPFFAGILSSVSQTVDAVFIHSNGRWDVAEMSVPSAHNSSCEIVSVDDLLTDARPTRAKPPDRERTPSAPAPSPEKTLGLAPGAAVVKKEKVDVRRASPVVRVKKEPTAKVKMEAATRRQRRLDANDEFVQLL
jgi:hypothetical protein